MSSSAPIARNPAPLHRATMILETLPATRRSYFENLYAPLVLLSAVCLQLTLASTLDDQTRTTTTTNGAATAAARSDQDIRRLCEDCRLTSDSVEDLIRRPRQMDAYGRVEARLDLDKIKKAVCKDLLGDGERERCRSFYFEHQASIQRWKQHQQQQRAAAAASSQASGQASGRGGTTMMTFLDFVCIRDLKLCCPEQSYGPRCTKCSRCPEAANQRCDGEGTRAGNGSCVCRPGHAGDHCDTCLPGYYNANELSATSSGGATHSPRQAKQPRQPGVARCRPCHRACRLCHGERPQDCQRCARGYKWQGREFGCSDVDECLEQTGGGGGVGESGGPACTGNTFCVNTEGSHYCYECDRACQGCHGDGPDMCLKCAHGYKLAPTSDGAGHSCVATRQTILPPEANYYRYAVYLGLCVSTCIILHNSVYLASLVGLCVALYIGLSEYIMSGHPAGAAGAGPLAQMASLAGSFQEQLMSQQQQQQHSDL